MAIVYNPYSELLREPNLLVPGKKPVGIVAIDRSHPLASQIVMFVLFRGKNPVDYNGDIDPQVTGTVSSNIIDGNRCLYVADNNANYIDLNTSRSDLSGSKITVAGRSGFSDTSKTTLFNKTVDNTAAWRLFSNLATKSRFRLFTTSGAVNVDSAVGLTANKLHTVVGTYDGSTMRLYQNGVQVNTGAQTGTVTVGTHEVSTYQDSVSSANAAWFDWFGLWDRTLSAAEVKAISYDPYQILIPS